MQIVDELTFQKNCLSGWSFSASGLSILFDTKARYKIWLRYIYDTSASICEWHTLMIELTEFAVNIVLEIIFV